MTEFNLADLERALAPKRREPSLKLKPYSREELISKAKRMAKELNKLRERRLRTRYNDESWMLDSYGSRFSCGGYDKDDDKVPIEVLKKLVVNGQKRLKSYHDMINQLVMTNPSLALEANLEGKTGMEVMSYAYDQRVEQVNKFIRNHVSVSQYLKPEIYIKFHIELDMNGKTLELVISAWLHRSNLGIEGVRPYPTNQKEVAALAFFIQNTDKIIAEIGRQLEGIKIKKEVTK